MPTTTPRRLPSLLHVLLLLLSLAAVRPARASHLLGGELSYTYLDDKGPANAPYRYRITLTGYYNGLWPAVPGVRNPPTSVQFDLYDQTTSARLFSQNSEPVTNFGSPVYPRVPSGCNISGPSQPFYLLKYSATVSLPFSADGYYAVCTQANRNLGLTNVNNPAGNSNGTVPMTLYVRIPTPLQNLSTGNHSPVFSDTAVAVVCSNDTTILLNNAVDPDGDRLVYSFGTPYAGRNSVASFPPLPNPVTYNPGYGFSGITPLGTGPGNFAIINALTGTAKYGATTNGLYVVAVDVGEYRTINGTETLIGTTRRDLQLVVATCPATKTPSLTLPAATTVNGGSGAYTIGEGQTLTLPLSASQADGHPLALTLNSILLDGPGGYAASLDGDPGTVVAGNITGTAVKTGTGTVSGTFSFTPGCGTARPTSYDVAVTVKDNGCAGKSAVAVIRITVVKASGPTAIAGDATICSLNTTHSYTASGGTAPKTRWRAVGGTFVGGNTGPTVQVTWTSLPGKVVAIGLSAPGDCPTDSVSKTVTLTPTPPITVAGNLTICRGGSTSLTATGAGTSYTVTGGPVSGTGPFVLSPTATTTYTITSNTLTSGCTSTAQVTVTVNPLPAAATGPAVAICAGGSAQLGAAPVAGSTYQWSPATGLSSATVANPTVTLPNAGTTPVTQTYTLTETTTATGCQNTGSVTVTVNPLPIAQPGAAVTTCSGVPVSIGAAPVAGYTYSWSPSTGLSSATVANPTVTLTNTTGAATSQTYTLTVTNSATTCASTGTVVVTVNPAVTAQPGAAVALCSGGSAQLGAAPVAGYTYSWSPATGLSSATAANPTVTLTNTTASPSTQTYTLTTTNTATGCVGTATVAVTVNPLPLAQPGAAVAICSNSTGQLGAAPVAGYTYQWSPATGLSDPTVANPTVTLPNPTQSPITQVYTLTVTNAATTCASTASVTVTVNPRPLAEAGAAVAFCSGGSAQLGAAPVPGYTYSWSPATGLSSPTAANPTVTLTNATQQPIKQVYTLTVTNASGCTQPDTVTVTVNPLPIAQPGAAVTFCAGGSAQLGAAPVAGYTYSWSPATGLSSATAANPTVTLPNATQVPITQPYTLTVTNAATGCKSTGTVTATVNPLPIAQPGAAVTTCSGVPVGIGAAPVAGYTYSWSPATGLSSATVANPTVTLTNTTGAATTQPYTLTVTNSATTCASTGTVVVTVNPAVTAQPGAAIALCSGGSGQLGAAPVAGYTYSWSPATGLSSATSANPTVTLTNTGGAATVQTYTLTTTNAATGCVGTATVAVTVNPLPVVQPGAAVATCSGVPVSLGAAPVAGYTYSWSPATGLSDATAANPSVTLPNTTAAPLVLTYTLTVTNSATSCVSTGTVAVTINPAALPVAGPDKAVCDNSTVTLGVAALPGYSYQWSPSTNLSSATAAQPVLTGHNLTAAPLTRRYTVRATTASGCVALDSVLVTINPRPAADTIVGPKSVCPTITGIVYTVQTPRANAYQWTVTGGNLTSGQGTARITVDWPTAGTGAVRVQATNPLGCTSDVAQVPVSINRILQTATPTGPTSVCQAGGPYSYQTVLATGSLYSWQLFGTAQGSLVNTGNKTSITFTSPGTAKLLVTETSDPAGGICRGTSDTLTIEVKPSPAANLTIQGPAHFCVGSGPVSYALPGMAGSTYVFTLNGTVVAGSGNTVTIPNGTAAGSYTLTAQETTSGNCAGIVYTTGFVIDPLPGAISISGPKYVCPSGLTQPYTVANANSTSTYQWTVTGGSIASGQGTASVTVTFAPGLTANATVSVQETSAAGCTGTAVTLPVVPDNATAPLLDAASVSDGDNTKVVLTFRVTAPNSPNPVQILRREAGSGAAFAVVGTVPTTATSYTDDAVNAAQTAYEYSLSLTTGCGDILPAPVSATTILLRAVAVPGSGGRNEGSTSLSWSAYQGAAVTQYVIYQQLDGHGYTQLTTVDASTLQYTVPNTGQGFTQCYAVRATLTSPTAAPLVSSSNTACVDFAEKTAFYNIITPNGDGLNDKLEIDNVQLYPGNSMQIFNRWGREVFSTTNYNNQSNYWGGDPGIAPGVYYYLFKLADGTATKGWVEVVR